MRWELLWAERHEEHIARHGVTPTEVEKALSDKRAIIRRKGDRYEVIGATDAGRTLLVAVEPIANALAVVVTARNATDNEKRRYRRRR